MIATGDDVRMASILILILLVLGPLAYFLGTDSRVDDHDRRRR
jgi:hypothetical protein